MLYANTDDGSSALWVCDGSGVVVDNISIYGAERAPILEQINEHYGTSFTGWSDNEMGLRFGDTVPNWDAYEKIEMQGIKVKIQDGSNSFAFGEIINNKIILKMQDEDKFFIANSNGEIYTTNSNAASWLHFVAIPQINSAGYNVTNYELQISQYQIGDVISDWSDYTLIPQ